MAGPRPLMSLLDTSRRDRITRLPQHQGPVAPAVGGSMGFQTLQQHPHFSLSQHQRFEGLEEEELGRVTGGGGLWAVATHEQQQRVLASDALRQRRVNTIQSLPTLANSLIHQGPGPGPPPTDWDGGGGLGRHIAPLPRGRMDRNPLLLDEHVMLRQQQSALNLSRGGEFARGISREVFAGGLRLRDSREEILSSEFVNSAMRSHVNVFDEARVGMSRAYQRPAEASQQQQQQILDPLSRNRGMRFGPEENGHAELIARYGDRSSSRNLERAHAAIGPAYQLENFSKKRQREEEADLDNRERLIRHRRLSGIDGPSPPHHPIRSPPRSQLKAHLQQKERNQEIQQHKAKHWQRQRQQTEAEEHEEGQLSPPKRQHLAAKSKSKVPKQERDVMVASSGAEATANMDIKASVPRNRSLEFLPSSRPHSRSSRSPAAREIGISVGDELKPRGRSNEQSLPTRERPPSPRYKSNERMLQRVDRAGSQSNERMLQRVDRAGSRSDLNSILASDLSDMLSKEGNKESLNHSSALNSSKSLGRGHPNGPHHKQHQQRADDSLRRDLRSLNARSHGSGSAEHDRFRKESSGRTESVGKQKPSKTVAKDSRHVGEMTISVPKHGQRIVKVEEYKPRDPPSRIAGQTNKDYRLSSQRGGSVRGGSDHPFTVSSGAKDRVAVTKRKEYEGRPPATPQDKTRRSNSSKVGGGTHQQYPEKTGLQDRLSPYFQLEKDELDAPTDKFEPHHHRTPSIFTRLAGSERSASPEKYWPEPHRTPSIFTRLAGFRTETNLPRAPAETKRKDGGVVPVHDKGSLPSSSRKSPNVSQATSRNDDHGSFPEFPGFQVAIISKRTDFSREFDNVGSMNLNRKNAERFPGKLAEPYERPNNDSQIVQAQHLLIRNESIHKPKLESIVSRLSHSSQKVFPPLDNVVEGSQKDLRLLEGPVIKSDHLNSRQEVVALPSWNSGVTSRLLSSEVGPAEGHEPSPGSGLKVQPKVIATGHRKDQVSKKSSLNAEQAVEGSSAPVDGFVPGENSSHENCEGRTPVSCAEGGLPGLLAGRVASPRLDSNGEWFGSTISLGSDELCSPQSDLGENNPMNVGKPSEVVADKMKSVDMNSAIPPGFGSRTVMEPSRASWDATEFEQPNPSPAVETPSPVESVPKAVASEIHSDGDSESELSIAPTSSCARSTPKEVRLFGANLNANMADRISLTPKALEALERIDLTPTALEAVERIDLTPTALEAVERIDLTPTVLEAVERIDLKPTALEAVDNYVVDCTALPAMDHDQDSVSVKEIMHSTAIVQGSEKDPTVGQTGDEQLSHSDKPLEAEQSVVICNDPSKSIANDLPLAQGQLDELPTMPQEQQLPLPHPENITAAAATQGGHLSSSHATGARTWRRGTSSSNTIANGGNVFRATSSYGGRIQSGISKSDQNSAYVRKGNSLVRAPTANVPSANDTKASSGLSGQARPVARKLSITNPVPFRNTFIAAPTTSKPYFSTSRKYVAPVIESDGAIVSSAQPVNPPKIPNSSNDSGKSQPSRAAVTKPLSQAATLASDPPSNSSTLLISHQERHTGATSSLKEAALDRPDNCLGGSSVCGTVKDTSSAIHSTDVPSVPRNPGTRVPDAPGIPNRLYVRRKANQLVAASAKNANALALDPENAHSTRTGFLFGHYFKRKTNQLIRSNSGKASSSELVARRNIPDEQGGGNPLVPKKTRRNRVLRQKKGSSGPSSWVWTLNGAAVGHANIYFAESPRTGPLLFPWKRQNSVRTPGRSQKPRPLPEVKKGSFLSLMSKRFGKVRPVQPVYTRSADGFSLHRSGVLSLGGGNLKWTKSLEKRAKQASEEVTKAVAEAERRKREEKEAVVEAAVKAKNERRVLRRAMRGEGERIVWVGLVRYKMDAASKTLQRIPDTQGDSGDTDIKPPNGWAMTSPLLTPRRSIIGGTVYLRVGNGNQLVRDPKAASRALASEKVRWSLHNARSRGVKKQQYCQFFTKFGKCNKESGKCLYIHDPEKVAVCTKFLKGDCTDVNCLLTHKVIPERMPDCSYFLEGLCTNENCSYRHVNVNPKAPYCEGFLRGYCKDGDKCNKKHTYVCSVYAETGECPDRSTCKFHHPLKKAKSRAPLTGHKLGTKNKRRYFSTSEPQSIRQKLDFTNNEESSVPIKNGDIPDDGSMEFISLGNIESDDEQPVTSPSQPWAEPGVTFTMKEAGFAEEDMEKWIKPTFLLQMTSSTTAAH